MELRKWTLCLLALAGAACGGRNAGERTAAGTYTAAAVFLPEIPPARLDAQQRRDFLRYHYWDRFDFADTLFIARVDTLHMLEAFAAYVGVLSDRPTDRAPMDSLMRRAAASRPMLEYFAMLAERVLADPNSPLRNDELRIPVLETLVASPFLDEYEKIAPAYDLHLAGQNRIGRRANDFRYTLASGASGRLYGLDAEYVLLFINNPGCPMCKQLREEICGSPMLAEMIERGRLGGLGGPHTLQEAYRSRIPDTWINAYDRGCVIRERELYDLKAIPALYLLDRDKRVLVKDSTDVPQIEEAIDRAG